MLANVGVVHSKFMNEDPVNTDLLTAGMSVGASSIPRMGMLGVKLISSLILSAVVFSPAAKGYRGKKQRNVKTEKQKKYHRARAS